jgi:hypothetical protein
MQRGCRAEPQLNDDNEHNLFEFDGAHANAIVRGLAVKAPFCGPTLQFLLSQIATKAFAVKFLGAFGQFCGLNARRACFPEQGRNGAPEAFATCLPRPGVATRALRIKCVRLWSVAWKTR